MSTSDSVRPTKKQREILAYIEHFIAEHGYSPSFREVMTGLDYTSVATVSLHINNLIRRGHLRKRDHSARSLEVVSASAPVDASWLATNVRRLLKDPLLTASDRQALLRSVELLASPALAAEIDQDK